MAREEYRGLIVHAFISAAVRHCPYEDYTSVEEEKQRIIQKELSALFAPCQNTQLNYGLWFNEHILEGVDDALCHNIPGNRDTTMAIRIQFRRAREALRHRTIYPRVSEKTIGKVARSEISSVNGLLGSFETPSTILELERIYHHLGIELQGPAEVRCAWKYNDLKPRVYYAQGPTVFNASKYIQAVFNVILDHFPQVHRKERYNDPEDSYASPEEVQFIYDYTSFTSNLPSARDFVQVMAEYFDDCDVTIIDSHAGPIVVSVGSLLRRYNEECNIFPLVDIGTGLGGDPEVVAHGAGMLGVPGNIAQSTLLHGLHLAYVSDSFHSCRCVGDDARGKRHEDHTVEELVFQLQNLGEVNASRTEEWAYEGIRDDVRRKNFSNYCKRSFHRDMFGRMVQGMQIFIPDLSILLDLEDEYHRPSFLDEGRKLKSVLRQWRRLLDQVQTISLTDIDREVLVHIQRSIHKRIGQVKQADKAGMVWYRQYCAGFVPVRMSKDEFGGDWKLKSLSSISDGKLSFLEPKYDGEVKPLPFIPGDVYVVGPHPCFKWLVQMEYAEMRNRVIDVDVVDLLADMPRFKFFLDVDYPAAYDLTILRLVPTWIGPVYTGLM